MGFSGGTFGISGLSGGGGTTASPVITDQVDFTTAEPNLAAASGLTYIHSGPTGAGSTTTGQTFTDTYLYMSDGVTWTETVPAPGQTVFDQSQGISIMYNGSAWLAVGVDGISTDAEQLLEVGTDGLHKLDPDNLISADIGNQITKGTDAKLYASGGGTAADAISPASDDAVGAIGVLTTEFALEDHKHPAQGVSSDAEQLLKAGTDGLHMLDPDDLVSTDVGNQLIKGTDAKLHVPAGPTAADAISPAADNAIGAIGISVTEFALEDHKHPAQGVSADPNNDLTVGTDGLHFLNGPDAATAISPAADDATGAIGVASATFALEDHKHPAQGVSSDVGNLVVVGTDGLHHLAAGAVNSDSGLGLLTNNMGQVSQDAVKVVVLGAAPVDGTTISYYVGQLFWDNANKKLYEATAKSTDPDAAGTGSTFAAVALGPDKYEAAFDATASWGTAAGSLYTITITTATHGMGTDPSRVEVQEDDGTSWVAVSLDAVKINKATGDVSISVSETPSGRFAGRVRIWS